MCYNLFYLTSVVQAFVEFFSALCKVQAKEVRPINPLVSLAALIKQPFYVRHRWPHRRYFLLFFFEIFVSLFFWVLGFGLSHSVPSVPRPMGM